MAEEKEALGRSEKSAGSKATRSDMIRLGIALFGGILVLNSYLAKIFFDLSIDETARDLSAFIGAFMLCVPIVWEASKILVHGTVRMNELVAMENRSPPLRSATTALLGRWPSLCLSPSLSRSAPPVGPPSRRWCGSLRARRDASWMAMEIDAFTDCAPAYLPCAPPGGIFRGRPHSQRQQHSQSGQHHWRISAC